MTIVVKKEFTFAFSTIVLGRRFSDVAELNHALTNKILARGAEEPAVSKSNVGGWHSANDFLRCEGPEPGQRFQRIAGAVKDFAAVERKVHAAALERSS